jgi:PPOX class probable F420-dependent enzyme
MSRRDQITMTPDEVDAYLHETHTMNVASIGPDGRVHLVAMWYGFLDGKPAFWTYGRSQKILNLRRDPRITCLVESGDVYEQLRGVELVGTATIVEDREQLMAIGASVMDRHAGPYTDEMRPVLETVGAKRVGVVVEVEKVVSWDHSKLGGVY